jgi:Di-N-acetylchitobiase
LELKTWVVGYDYPCIPPSNSTVCSITKVPFRGVECSDAAGREVCFSTLLDWLANNATSDGRMWDSTLQSPFFNMVDAVTGQQHQIWYDDLDSLRLKYSFADSMHLRGLAMWNSDCLDYSRDPASVELTRLMWEALQPARP